MRKKKSSSGSIQFEAVSPILTVEKQTRNPANGPYKHSLAISVDSFLTTKPKCLPEKSVLDQNSVMEDPLKDLTDVCWNPLDGPVMCKTAPKAIEPGNCAKSKKATNDICWNPLNDPVACKMSQQEKENPVMNKTSNNEMLSAHKRDKSSEASSEKDSSNVQASNMTKKEKTANLAKEDAKSALLAARMPCFDLETRESVFLPLLGICSLSDLGFSSDAEVAESLRKKVQRVFIA